MGKTFTIGRGLKTQPGKACGAAARGENAGGAEMQGSEVADRLRHGLAPVVAGATEASSVPSIFWVRRYSRKPQPLMAIAGLPCAQAAFKALLAV
ncbi:hypothetical protein [Rhodothalassium salexigens]|uniref:hypothetical protein n=1 Tax=Rhodothalassium salexigens TaxID=1086 RepID=UPI0019142D00|nr:hypothetical protein [Rhodothalassium salexigens]